MRIFSFAAFLIALGAGFFIFYIISRYSLERRSAFIRAFLRNVLFFNLLIIAGLFFNIIDWYLKDELPSRVHLWFQTGILIVLTVLKFFWLFSFLQMNRRIVDDSLSSRFKRIYVYMSVFFAVLLTLAFINVDNPWRFMLTRLLSVFIETLIIASAFGAILKLLLESHKKERIQKERGILLFSGLYLLLFSVILVSLTLGLFVDRQHADQYTLVNAVTMILYNFIPLIWLRRYGGFLGAVCEGEKGLELYDSTFEKYGITRREREVVRLLCAGKSNREVAAALFISAQTVKDHNKNIFRKTGVRNRVQLVNLLRKRDDPPDLV